MTLLKNRGIQIFPPALMAKGGVPSNATLPETSLVLRKSESK